MTVLSLDILRDRLRLDPETGVLFWRRCCRMPAEWNTRWAGRATSQTPNAQGYLSVRLWRREYLAHRVVFALHQGRWPLGKIDHRNMIRTDNHPDNLREASNAENLHNRGAQKNNSSGFCGVHWHAGAKKWRAQITANGRVTHLGYHSTAEAAARAYDAGARQFHGQFARVNFDD